MAQIIESLTPEKEFPVLFYLNAAEYESIIAENEHLAGEAIDIEILTAANRNSLL